MLLAAALVSILKPFVGPILWALLLAFLLHPVNAALRRRLPPGKGRGRAALFMTVAVTLAIILPAALVAIAVTFVIRLLAIFFDWKTHAIRSVMPQPPSD